MTEKMLKCHREFKVYFTHKKIRQKYRNTPKIQKYIKNTKYTTALQFNTSQDIPESISYQATQVVFEVCTRVENITDQETSIYCMTGLALPACILVAVVISSMICGYVLARMCSKRQYLGPQSTGINPLSSACPLPTNQPLTWNPGDRGSSAQTTALIGSIQHHLSNFKVLQAKVLRES